MHESSNSGYDKNNYLFSKCSILSIHKVILKKIKNLIMYLIEKKIYIYYIFIFVKVLYNLAHKCFVEEKTALCGNGILEVGEECDAGGYHLGTNFDRCCTNNCKLKKNAVCSPRHSECCMKNCTYASTNVSCHPKSTDLCKSETFCE